MERWKINKDDEALDKSASNKEILFNPLRKKVCRKAYKLSEDLVAKNVPGGWREVVSSGRYEQGEERSWNLQDDTDDTDDSAEEQKSLGWKLQKDQE